MASATLAPAAAQASSHFGPCFLGVFVQPLRSAHRGILWRELHAVRVAVSAGPEPAGTFSQRFRLRMPFFLAAAAVGSPS